MRVTDQARRLLVLAAGAAHDRGDKPVSGYHLLLGLADADGGVRHVLGSGRQRLRQVAVPPAESGGGSAVVTFGTAKDIVERAIAHANECGRDRATSADILLAALGPADGPVASALSADGFEPATIRAALADGDHGACCDESGISEARIVLAEMGAQAGRIPGRWRAAAGVMGGLVPYVLLWWAALAVASGPEPILFGAFTTLSALLGVLIGRRRHVRDAIASAPTLLPVPECTRPLLDRLSLRQLEVRTHAEGSLGRCCRLGRRAWIVIGPAAELDPQLARFVLWHEVAHLARRDMTARGLGLGVSVGLVADSIAGRDLRAVAIAVGGTALLTVAGRWWSEAACDRFAVRRAGPAAFHAWAAGIRSGRALLLRQNRLPRSARLKALFTHPPLALRTALHANAGDHDRDTPLPKNP